MTMDEINERPDEDNGNMRSFATGATRDTAEGKLLYDKFLCPNVLKQFAKFMNMNRLQSDGKLRDGDNWQKGIPMDLYLECLARHYHEFWTETRDNHPERTEMIGAACGIMFNVMGYLHEWLKTHTMVDFDGDEPTNEMAQRQRDIEKDQAKEEGMNELCPFACGELRGRCICEEIDAGDYKLCSCGCGRDDGECDGMSSVNDDDTDMTPGVMYDGTMEQFLAVVYDSYASPILEEDKK